MNKDEFFGAWKEFKEWTKIQHDEIKQKLTVIEMRLDELREWRWRIVGASALVAALIGIAANLVSALK